MVQLSAQYKNTGQTSASMKRTFSCRVRFLDLVFDSFSVALYKIIDGNLSGSIRVFVFYVHVTKNCLYSKSLAWCDLMGFIGFCWGVYELAYS